MLNDDTVFPGKGFGPHARHNMETVSIPLDGELEHWDSVTGKHTIHRGEIQTMSTGSGILHSEYNKDNHRPLKFLHIWILPDKTEVEPRYSHVAIDDLLEPNRLVEIVKPWPGDGKGACIHQQAWIFLGKLEVGTETEYRMRSEKSHGVYLFVIDGEISLDDDLELLPRDGVGILNTDSFRIRALTAAEVLLIEVPPRN